MFTKPRWQLRRRSEIYIFINSAKERPPQDGGKDGDDGPADVFHGGALGSGGGVGGGGVERWRERRGRPPPRLQKAFWTLPFRRFPRHKPKNSYKLVRTRAPRAAREQDDCCEGCAFGRPAEPDTYASDQPDGFPILSALCYH
jgi:hypothetical protein